MRFAQQLTFFVFGALLASACWIYAAHPARHNAVAPLLLGIVAFVWIMFKIVEEWEA